MVSIKGIGRCENFLSRGRRVHSRDGRKRVAGVGVDAYDTLGQSRHKPNALQGKSIEFGTDGESEKPSKVPSSTGPVM